MRGVQADQQNVFPAVLCRAARVELKNAALLRLDALPAVRLFPAALPAHKDGECGLPRPGVRQQGFPFFLCRRREAAGFRPDLLLGRLIAVG